MSKVLTAEFLQKSGDMTVEEFLNYKMIEQVSYFAFEWFIRFYFEFFFLCLFSYFVLLQAERIRVLTRKHAENFKQRVAAGKLELKAEFERQDDSEHCEQEVTFFNSSLF